MASWTSFAPSVVSYGSSVSGSSFREDYYSGSTTLKGGWVDGNTYAVHCVFQMGYGSLSGDGNGYMYFQSSEGNSPQSEGKGYGRTMSSYTQYLVDDAATVGKTYSIKGQLVGGYSPNFTSLTVQAKPTFTITFDANGGSGTQTSVTKTLGEDYTLPSSTFTKSGYEVKTYNTSADGSGTSYAVGGTYSVDADVTLYAIWTPVSIMHINVNGSAVTFTEIYAKVSGSPVQIIGVYRNNNGVAEQTL